MKTEDLKARRHLAPPELAPVTYLTMDEIARGVGASQVLPYVEGLARRGVRVSLHTFEHQRPPPELRRRLDDAGVTWHPHRFRRGGSLAGAVRVVQGAALVRHRTMVHARSDLAAAAAVLGRPKAWVWDVRSFWADERIAMGNLVRGSPEERVLRGVESASAGLAGAIVTLTAAAIDVLARRHGERIREIATVIPTCVDTERFALAPMPGRDNLQLVLSGSFNPLYDLTASLDLVAAVRKRRPAAVTLIRPNASRWDGPVIRAGGSVQSASFAEMPGRLRASHAGLSIRLGDPDSLAGCAPIKVAEFLATGRPVVVNARLGDMDDLIARYQCGVVVADQSVAGLETAAEELCTLVDDDRTPDRCRAAAVEQFSLERGVTNLVEVYARADQAAR